jgi:hypothetical protein
VGDDIECFEKAAELSLKINFRMLEEPVEKVCRRAYRFARCQQREGERERER